MFYERNVEADFRITAAGSLDAMHAAQQATFVLICAFVGTKAVEVCLKMVNNTNQMLAHRFASYT